ncbi:MAG: DUF882 domain-containing protein [Bacteroidaceae bacterium]|nr:DUF882 domain-containing protein [Bacteroidaceae bacterium]
MNASKNDKINLSEHFTLGEMTVTTYKTDDGNIPSRVAIENMTNLCEKWLEELRFSYNFLYCLAPGEDYETSEDVQGIRINSGYRSPEVNQKCGGAKNSNHLTGCAVDIHCAGKEQAIRYACILLDIADGKKLDFDELILEKRGTTIWVHFAVRPKGNRRYVDF